MLSGQKMPKKVEKWPKHHQIFFGTKIRFESTPEKKACLLTIGGRYLAENVKKKGGGDLQKPLLPKFPAILAEKQHLLNFFFNFW